MKHRPLAGDLGGLPAEPDARIVPPLPGELALSKRYLIFGGEIAVGGWNDFDSATADPEEAKARAQDLLLSGKRWAHVVDADQLQVILALGRDN